MIAVLFNILFTITPLAFYKHTSELFEFNKIVLIYFLTIIIVGAWAIKSIVWKKFIFRHTMMDLPLLAYLGVYFVSTILSIDPTTSWFGYYSRFNGGFISQVCYALLYWAFVSNLNKKQALHTIFYLLLSTILASALSILEHFGIFVTCGLMGLDLKTSCWIQDVQNRSFSTLGQPNWLAALVVALLPVSLAFSFAKKSVKTSILPYFFSLILYVSLLFTKSRSGLLAFGVESAVFWGLIFGKFKMVYLKQFLVFNLLFLVLFFVFDPLNYSEIGLEQSQVQQTQQPNIGGTPSGEIRKIVWKGAIEVWQANFVFGTGPETFAFSYPKFRPPEHNLTSEWNFIYNKAHNEYLNLLANVGLLGFAAYGIIIAVSFLQIINYSLNTKLKELEIGLLGGYIAILVSNFFGFSVVATSLILFMFPATAVASRIESAESRKGLIPNAKQWIPVFIVFLTSCYLLYIVYRYWQADIYYNKGRLEKRIEFIEKSLTFFPNQPLFLNELAYQKSEKAKDLGAAKDALAFSENAVELSPLNLNYTKMYASLLIKFSGFDKNYLRLAAEQLNHLISLSPTDAGLYYQLGLLYIKIGEEGLGISALEKSISLKSNYKEARFALGAIYQQLGQSQKAIGQFEYILNNIDPNDELTKKYLKQLN